MESRNIAIMVALALGVLGSWAIYRNSLPDDVDDTPTARLGIGYYLNAAELIGMDETGRMLYRIRAVEANQATEDNSITMTDIRIDYLPADDMPWQLTADTARVPPDGNIIQLTGRVLAVSGSDEGEAASIVTTYLELDTEAKTASTQRKVAVNYGSRRLNATGLVANLETNDLQLLSNVNGKFVP